jgi:ferredoxin-NADP reductase
MMQLIDNILNKVTMYRLVVYELVFLLVAAGVLGFAGVLAVSPMFLAYSVVVLFVACWITNRLFAYSFDAPYNPESTWITALILALIITPPTAWVDTTYLPLALWASAWAVASKYIFAVGKKHLFNPAAFGVAITSIVLGLSASWWVGTASMLPLVLVGGLLIVRKIHRFDLWWACVAVFGVGITYMSIAHSTDLLSVLTKSFINTPLFFFATVMLTEPMTTPPSRMLRILYGAIVGFLFLPNISIGSFYFTPELALLAGNLFSYFVSPDEKLVLTLKEKIRLSRDVFEFVFTRDCAFTFHPGEYLEWTLAHAQADSRSVRRYFTIASAPTGPDVRLGVKFYSPSSSFKTALLAMQVGETIVASQRAGDFTLPKNANKKLVFIAGGIGITPFRSMLQYLLDIKERRDITVLFANKTPEDVVYRDVLDRAQRELGIPTVYAFSDASSALPQGAVRTLDAATIATAIPDYQTRMFYISGPQGMVAAYKRMLLSAGVRRSQIKTDYFPGFA